MEPGGRRPSGARSKSGHDWSSTSFAVVFATLAAYEQCGVVVWHRHHAENLARGRPLWPPRRLACRPSAIRRTAAGRCRALGRKSRRYRLDVARAVFVSSPNAATCIAYEYFPRPFIPRRYVSSFLYAEVRRCSRRGRSSRRARCLPMIPRECCRARLRPWWIVLAQNALLDKETRKSVQLFLQAAIVLRRRAVWKPCGVYDE